jgi:hypothetical protein
LDFGFFPEMAAGYGMGRISAENAASTPIGRVGRGLVKDGDLRKVSITPLPGEKRFRFLFSFYGRERSVEFEITFVQAMILMEALQEFQEKYKIPLPQPAPSKRKKPHLFVVKPDEPDE